MRSVMAKAEVGDNVIDVDRVPEADRAQPPADDDPLILHDLWRTEMV